MTESIAPPTREDQQAPDRKKRDERTERDETGPIHASGVAQRESRVAYGADGRLDRYEVGLAGELHQLRREFRRLPEEARRRAEVLHEVTRMAGAQ